MNSYIVSHCIDSGKEGAGVAAVFNQIKINMKDQETFYAFDNKEFYKQLKLLVLLRNKKLISILRRCSIFHVHDLWSPLSIILILCIRPKNVIISPHGMLEKFALKKGARKKAVFLLIYRLFSIYIKLHVHCLTEVEAKQAEEKLNTRNIHLVPNGVSLQTYGQKQMDSKLKLVFLSRIHPKKGLDRLLRFAAVLKSNELDFSLTIYGFGEKIYIDEINAKITELALEKHVVLGGAVFDEKKFDILREADYLVLPSFSEGLPLVILESWSVGTPSIHTKNCNLNIGFTEGAAFDFENMECPLLVSYWFSLLQENKIKMSLSAYDLCRSKFDINDIMQRHEDFYSFLESGI